MTLHITPEMLEASYEFLKTTAPFNRWNLPEGEDIRFKVARDPKVYGWYRKYRGRHTIAISSTCIGYAGSLLAVMAHEIIHLHQALVGMESPCAEHNAAFNKLAAQVCKIHGFDPKSF